jgi:hypothetical protein
VERQRRVALAKISVIEASQARAIREHLLGDSGATLRLQAIDDEIVQLREQLVAIDTPSDSSGKDSPAS